jgi:hypothetical protein
MIICDTKVHLDMTSDWISPDIREWVITVQHQMSNVQLYHGNNKLYVYEIRVVLD